MSPAIEQLYDYFVGQPRPERWPEELQSNPMLAHGQHAFAEGLRLCAEIVSLHGGSLHFDSREGQGTTVTVELKKGENE